MDFDAITLDTCILESQSFNLENGLLSRFEQFSKTKDIIFVMSKIVLNEMISHMEEDTKESISMYKDALKTGLFYRIDDDITEEKIKNVKKLDIKSIVEKRIKKYVDKTGLQIIPTDGVDIQKIIEKYFNRKPPFSERKKEEFPDALALQSLENWAVKEAKRVLVISNDNDWQEYCKDSTNLICVKTIEEALSSLYKDENFSKQLLIDIFSDYDKYETLMNSINEEIMNTSDKLSINLDVDGFYECEENYLEADFIDVHFPKPDSIEIIDVDSKNKIFTFSIPSELTFHIEAEYGFYTGSEEDYVGFGGNTVSNEYEFKNQLIISIKLNDKDLNRSEIVSVDYTNYSLYHSISLEPDYSDCYYDYE